MSVTILVVALLAACSVRITPSPQPTRERTPVLTAPSTVSSTAAPDEPDAPLLPPIPTEPRLVLEGRAIAPIDRGGCASVYHAAEFFAGDLCGPHAFALDAPGVSVTVKELTIAAPAGWVFAAEPIGADDAWYVAVAPVASLEALGEDEQETLVGLLETTLLGRDRHATGALAVPTPSAPGDYLLELGANLHQDPWTFVGALYFWRITVD